MPSSSVNPQSFKCKCVIYCTLIQVLLYGIVELNKLLLASLTAQFSVAIAILGYLRYVKKPFVTCKRSTIERFWIFLTSVAISSSNAVLFCNHMNFNCSFSITIHLHIATLRQTPYTVLRNYQKTLWEGCEKHGAKNTTHIIDFF